MVTAASAERAASSVSALSAQTFAVPGEPTVDLVREGARRAQNANCDVILSLGGGSIIDAGKAIGVATGSRQNTGIVKSQLHEAPEKATTL